MVAEKGAAQRGVESVGGKSGQRIEGADAIDNGHGEAGGRVHRQVERDETRALNRRLIEWFAREICRHHLDARTSQPGGRRREAERLTPEIISGYEEHGHVRTIVPGDIQLPTTDEWNLHNKSATEPRVMFDPKLNGRGWPLAVIGTARYLLVPGCVRRYWFAIRNLVASSFRGRAKHSRERGPAPLNGRMGHRGDEYQVVAWTQEAIWSARRRPP